MGVCVTVNKPRKQLKEALGHCYDCKAPEKVTWERFRRERIRCAFCGGEMDLDFAPNAYSEMNISASTMTELLRLLDMPRTVSGQSGRLDPKVVLDNKDKVAGHRLGRTLVAIAEEARKAGTDIRWA